jgi:hypothetical protein
VQSSRLAIALGLVVPALTLGGCSGEPEPRFAPAESSPPAVSEDPSGQADVPALPAAARGDGEPAARAFVHFWLDTLNYAIESGDSEALESISSPRCRECGRIVQTIDDIYRRGGQLSGGTWRMKSLRPLPLDRGADWAGYVTAAVSQQKVTDTDGESDRFYEAGPGFMYTYAAKDQDSWRMVWMHISL